MTKSVDAGLAAFRTWTDKNVGKGVTGSAATLRPPLEVIPSGSQALDFALVTGGYPCGYQIELFGMDGLGKTTMALLAVVEAQRAFPARRPVYIDVEHKLQEPWAAQLGVDLDLMELVVPETAEETADLTRQALMLVKPSIVVVDSLGAFINKAELDKEAGDAVVGNTAKIITRMVKLCANAASKQGAVVLYINQLRADIGGYAATTTPGGYAKNYMAIQRLKMSGTDKQPIERVVGGDVKEQVARELAVRVIKNGLGPSNRTAKFLLVNRPTDKHPVLGIDPATELATLGIIHGVITQSGSWYLSPDGEKFQGKDAVADHLRATPKAQELVRAGLLDQVAGQVVASPLEVQ